jgi:hypothetical protein
LGGSGKVGLARQSILVMTGVGEIADTSEFLE